MNKKHLFLLIIAGGLGIFAYLYYSQQPVNISDASGDSSVFSMDTSGLPPVETQEVVELEDGDKFDLTITMVSQKLGDQVIKRLAYNGSIPGPTIKVKQGSTVFINLINEGDVEALLHSHGLRLENQFDGTHAVQDPIAVGESFEYKLTFPDAGVYWYHPHHREDYAQDMGLYGNYIVEPNDSEYWSSVNREVTLMVDDILLENGQPVPYNKEFVDHAIMGRYGNTLLVNGKTDYELQVDKGEVVRFFITNVANTRTFKLSLPGAELKLVGSDVGKYEREVFINDFIISPSERYIVEAYFPISGNFSLIHKTPDGETVMGKIKVSDQEIENSYSVGFNQLRLNKDVVEEIDKYRKYFDGEPDKIIDFTVSLTMDMSKLPCHQMSDGTWMGDCEDGADDMDAEMEMSGEAGPGFAGDEDEMMKDDETINDGEMLGDAEMKMEEDEMKMNSDDEMQMEMDMSDLPCHQMADGTWMGDCQKIEWEDDMKEMNAASTTENVKWMIVDTETGQANTDIDWKFKVGDVVKIRLVNDPKSVHPMQHPFHIHGQRFLVLSTNGVKNENLVWKDTTLLQRGDTVDILLEISNPGVWLMHCHISEHIESGMKLRMLVTDN